MVERFKRYRSSGTAIASVLLSRGILNKKNSRDTTHFNADASNTRALLPKHSFCRSAQYFTAQFRIRHWRILQEIQQVLKKKKHRTLKFTDRIIFMSMFNDMDWTRKGSNGICNSNSEKVKDYAMRFLPRDTVRFWVVDRKRSGMELFLNGDSSNMELLFRIIHSVNQLRIYGAVASWCEQFGLTEEQKGREKLKSVNRSILTSVKLHEAQLLVSLPKMA